MLESRANRKLPDQLMRIQSNIRRLVAASVLCFVFMQGASATGVEPAKDLRVDPSLCLAAALARDDDKTIAACGALIDNAKTEKGRPHQGADRTRRRP